MQQSNQPTVNNYASCAGVVIIAVRGIKAPLASFNDMAKT